MKLFSQITTTRAALLCLLVTNAYGSSTSKSTKSSKRPKACKRPEGRPVRFEKFAFPEEPELPCREKIVDFPLSRTVANFLKEKSNSISVMLPSEGCTSISFTDLKTSLKNETMKTEKGLMYPLHPPPHPDDAPKPNNEENHAFWEEFIEVMEAVGELKTFERSFEVDPSTTDPLPKVMERITDLWNGKRNITEVAEAVHDEFPGVYHAEMITKWLGNKTLKRKSALFPTTGNKDFLRFPVMLSDLVGHAIRMVAPCDFALKWDEGRARPEEVAWMIKEGHLTIPDKYSDRVYELFAKIGDYNSFTSPTNFTAYPEGSPNHPSYPAMHSAASAASFWLDVTMDLNEEQRCEARMLDYSISYARTVAGVHYSSDNIAGLMVGQEILAKTLPRYLHDEYGADYTAVVDAVVKAKYDWTTFSSSDCWNNPKFVQYRTIAAKHEKTCKGKDSSETKPEEMVREEL